MVTYEKGHCILLNSNTFIIKDLKDEMAFVVHLSDPIGTRGRWVLKSLLPVPHAKINI